MKNFYYTIGRKVEEYGKEKQVYFVLKCSDSENLFSKLKRYHDLIICQPTDTKKQACKLADFWNECAKENGNYLYQEDNNIYPSANCIFS